MTTLEELVRVHDRLTTVHVERWVARGLLRPTANGERWIFEPVDVARARLLADLSDDLEPQWSPGRMLAEDPCSWDAAPQETPTGEALWTPRFP